MRLLLLEPTSGEHQSILVFAQCSTSVPETINYVHIVWKTVQVKSLVLAGLLMEMVESFIRLKIVVLIYRSPDMLLSKT